MSATLTRIQLLAARGSVRLSDRDYDELAAEGILFSEIEGTVTFCRLIEDHPNAHAGPTVLVLQRDTDRQPVHVVWGIPAGSDGPAVLVTAYRPDPAKWTKDFTERVTQ